MAFSASDIERVGHAIASTRRSREALARELAEAFGWATADQRTRTIGGETGVSLSEAMAGPDVACIFAVPHRTNTAERNAAFNEAVSFAYHSTVRWGVFAEPSGLTLFNSHWLVDGRWFQLPPISWPSALERSTILSKLSSHKFSEVDLDRIAIQRRRPEQTLAPVDDALVTKLDKWRDQALRHSREFERADEMLQEFYAQLFVLRTVEDRKLQPSIPSLDTATSAEGALFGQLGQIFSAAKDLVCDDLFARRTFERIPNFVVNGVIQDSYIADSSLAGLIRYNFSWIQSDVLGSAYEKYISIIHEERELPPQLDMFDSPEREVERISARRAGGIYYTPRFLSKTIAEDAVSRFFDRSNDDAAIPSVLDFACGSGSFLVAALDAVLRRLKARDSRKNWAREIVDQKRIIGIDVDPKAVILARLNLWQRLTEESDPLPLPSLRNIIVVGDALREETWAHVPDQPDIVVGNPPFIASTKVPDRPYLESSFETAKGRFDFSYLFVELALRKLGTKGVLGLVVPNRMFTNRDASTIRRILTNNADLGVIMDFGTVEVFSRTSAYIGVVIAAMRAEFEPPAKSVKVIQVRDITSRLMAKLLLEAASRRGYSAATLHAYTADHPRGEAPWILLSTQAKQRRVLFEQNSVSLGEIAEISQGIRTGANDVFILSIVEELGELIRIKNGFGETKEINRRFIHPIAMGSEIKAFSIPAGDQYVIYPYSKGKLIRHQEFKSLAPQTWEYLVNYRSLLASRAGISESIWYALVRPRNEEWLTAKKLMVRDLAPELSFGVDPIGKYYLVGGTAVVPTDEDLLAPLLAYLNSQRVDQYLREVTPHFRGGFQKFEPQHLARIPVPRRLIESQSTRDQLANLSNRLLIERFEEGPTKYEALISRLNRLVERLLK